MPVPPSSGQSVLTSQTSRKARYELMCAHLNIITCRMQDRANDFCGTVPASVNADPLSVELTIRSFGYVLRVVATMSENFTRWSVELLVDGYRSTDMEIMDNMVMDLQRVQSLTRKLQKMTEGYNKIISEGPK